MDDPSDLAPRAAGEGVVARRVLLVRGAFLNRFETAPFELLAAHGYQVTAVSSWRPEHEQVGLNLPVERLRVATELLDQFRIGSARRLLPGRLPLDHLLGLPRLAVGVDILHAAETFLPFSEQCARLRSPARRLVLTCWENIPFLHDDDPALARRKRFVAARTDRFIAVSPEARDALQAEGIAAERIEVIPPGIHRQRFQVGAVSSFRADLGLTDDDQMILYVGRLIREKGVVELVRSFAEVLAGNRRAVLVLVGAGAERGRVEIVARALGVDHRVRLADFVGYDKLPSVYASADLFVLPSLSTPYWQEQFGMVLAEALSAGVPIVTTRTGSIASVVGDAAVLVPPYDIGALAAAIGTLLNDGTRRSELAARGVERSERFEATAVASRLATTYRRVLGESP